MCDALSMDDNAVQNIQTEDSTRDQASSMDSANATDNNASVSQGKRLKIFNKAMEKSLQRLIADARYVSFVIYFSIILFTVWPKKSHQRKVTHTCFTVCYGAHLVLALGVALF